MENEIVQEHSKTHPLKEKEIWNKMLTNKPYKYLLCCTDKIDDSLSEIKYKSIAYTLFRVSNDADVLEAIKRLNF